MKGPQIDQTVYNYMFPKPKTTDPQNFQGLLQRQLVPEVRLETQAFYGHLSSQEAKYPGLDYSHQPHRIRLSRYTWHRRLFRAFDGLGLTKHEIAGLTKWEGTRWAKERFEREQGIVIRDTTADGIGEWIPPHLRDQTTPQVPQHADVEGIEDEGVRADYDEEIEEEAENVPEADDDLEDSDSEMQSVGVELNERLRAAVAQREAGDDTVTMDEAWEKWLHERLASGDSFAPDDLQPTLSPHANIPGTRPATSSNNPTMFSRWISSARAGQWSQIPEVVHPFVRQELEALSRRDGTSAGSQSTSPSSASTISNSPSPTSSSSSTTRRTVNLHPTRVFPRSVPTTSPPEVSSGVTMSRLLTNREFAESYARRPLMPQSSQNLPPGNSALRYSLLASRREPRFNN